MAYRAIVRFSLDGDANSTQRNTVIVPQLEALGFVNIGTATWSHDALPPASIPALATVLNDIMTVSARTGGMVTLDHIWSYVDIPVPH